MEDYNLTNNFNYYHQTCILNLDSSSWKDLPIATYPWFSPPIHSPSHSDDESHSPPPKKQRSTNNAQLSSSNQSSSRSTSTNNLSPGTKKCLQNAAVAMQTAERKKHGIDKNILNKTIKELIETCKSGLFTQAAAILDPGCTLSDEAIAGITTTFFEESNNESDANAIPTTHATLFVRTFLTPRVSRLTQPASRLLFGALTTAAQHQPEAVENGLMREIIHGGTAGAAQCEVIGRLLNGAFNTDAGVRLVSCAADAAAWTEEMLSLIQTILSRSVSISDDILQRLLIRLEHCSQDFSNSRRFPKLIFVLASKYKNQVSGHKQLLEQIISSNTTFMVKTARNAINKL